MSSVFNALGKIIVGLIFLGFIVGSITTYYIMINFYPTYTKMQLVDQLNNILPKDAQLTTNPLNGEIILLKGNN